MFLTFFFVDENNKCPSDFHSMMYGCYKVEQVPVTYDVAVANCKIYGAKVAEPFSATNNLQIAMYMKSYDVDNDEDKYWIGINDREKNTQ